MNITITNLIIALPFLGVTLLIGVLLGVWLRGFSISVDDGSDFDKDYE